MDVAWLVKCLLPKHEDLSSDHQDTLRLDVVVVCVCNSRAVPLK